MSEHVEGRDDPSERSGDEVPGRQPRRYDASGRQRQAGRSRAAILAAARDCFLSSGFRGTTIAEVAAAGNVSTQQVYKLFGNKAGLVKAVFDVAIAGDDEPIAMIDRGALSDVRDEPDPHAKLRRYGEFVAETAPRHVPIQLLIRAAADTDAEAAALWDKLSQERLHGMTMFARDLGPHLRDGVTVEHARDLLWSTNSPELWHLLVTQRGWTPDKFGQHLTDTLTAALLTART
jgi:AcrR family transcriptional regulator